MAFCNWTTDLPETPFPTPSGLDPAAVALLSLCQVSLAVENSAPPPPPAGANRFEWGGAMRPVSYKSHVQTYTNPGRILVQEVLRSSARRNACEPGWSKPQQVLWLVVAGCVAVPDLEAGRDPHRKHRKDNAVRIH